ncbi:MAG: succinate dehydrogenase assembly factor 2 [Pelagibacterales bacterium MED-G40]|nr:MAG: succinate dehydrogenase assembly factor 2 [Pelagibacterales bacterium MED-G40]|tara:strand:+ start:859 stop:1113 length:255 start_codon:yes stop_codon:yes gene_type:complete
MSKLEILKKKLLYRSSYRGTKEMDILLSSFVKFYINKLGIDELQDLDKFLDLDDEIIYNFYQNNVSNNFLKKNRISQLLKKFKI